MAKSPQLSSEEYRLGRCCACSAAKFKMRDFVPPVHVQDNLKTPNVKGREGSDVTMVQCPSLTCIEQCWDADTVINGHLGACGKVTVPKNSLGQPPEGSGRQVNTMLNLRNEITCGGDDTFPGTWTVQWGQVDPRWCKKLGATTNLGGGKGLPSFWS